MRRKKPKDSLEQAMNLITEVSGHGFQWKNLRGPLAKVEEEWQELKQEINKRRRSRQKIEAEFGDYLFSLCNIAYFLDLSPRHSLLSMLRRFENRFRHVDKCVKRSGRAWEEFTLQELDSFWEEAKRRERKKC